MAVIGGAGWTLTRLSRDCQKCAALHKRPTQVTCVSHSRGVRKSTCERPRERPGPQWRCAPREVRAAVRRHARGKPARVSRDCPAAGDRVTPGGRSPDTLGAVPLVAGFPSLYALAGSAFPQVRAGVSVPEIVTVRERGEVGARPVADTGRNPRPATGGRHPGRFPGGALPAPVAPCDGPGRRVPDGGAGQARPRRPGAAKRGA